ncbi:MAG TPA: hypothetical protein PLC22_23260, partial [Gordonia sp. (in: high G+C Gram-positive bacteria)]|nr:hypothetical protein [Gordonia sp. (in: high G+C Gram-positive bacteria)]
LDARNASARVGDAERVRRWVEQRPSTHAPQAATPAPQAPRVTLPDAPQAIQKVADHLAKNTGDVQNRIDEALESLNVHPQITKMWAAAKKSGFELSPDQIALFNQYENQLPK